MIILSNIEQLLAKRKTEIEQLEAPEELELRLRSVLAKEKTRRRTSWGIRAAVACLAIFILSYNFSTLAYYGKTLVGYEHVMSGTLKELNKLGKGQFIGKSFALKNGATITLDGIMLDESQLIAFYCVKDPTGKMDLVQFNHQMRMEGLWGGYPMKSGSGQINEETKEIQWITIFEPPQFFEKKLHFRFGLSDKGMVEEGEIVFHLDRDKAMKNTLKESINQTLTVADRKIQLESILASPTRTVITGSIQNILELALDEISGERVRPGAINLKLIVNGENVAAQGAGMRTDMKGITFENSFEPLPENIQSVQVKVESMSADYDVKEKVSLRKDAGKQHIKVLGQGIEINKIHESKGGTYITITTEDTTILTRVHLIIDGKKIALKETVTNDHKKLTDGTVMHTRVLHFPATGKTYSLDIERMTALKTIDKIIDIPVNE